MIFPFDIRHSALRAAHGCHVAGRSCGHQNPFDPI